MKAVAQPTKQAFLYVFDRVTGRPLWPIEERPVPKGDVPGEWYSPTQPIPTKPAGYDRQGITENDLIDFTPELRREALEIVAWHKMGPLFTPPVVSNINGPLGTLMVPSQDGGTNWQGGSFDPETGILYVASGSTVVSKAVVPPYPGQSEMAYIEGNAVTGPRTTGGSGSAAGGGRSEFQPRERRVLTPDDPSRGPPKLALAVQGLPLLKPPYGRISAIDMKRGEILWQIAHGETPDDIKNHPLLKGMTIPRTGQAGSPGTLVTKTLLVSRRAPEHDDAGRARRDAARVRQSDGPRGRRRLHAGAAERLADDVHAERRAVSRRRDQRRAVRRRAARVQAAAALARMRELVEPALSIQRSSGKMTSHDITAIEQLVVRERESRDLGFWSRMRDCYHDDAEIDISWFRGSAPDLVAASRDMAARGMLANTGSGRCSSR